jgi:hypothetical protein
VHQYVFSCDSCCGKYNFGEITHTSLNESLNASGWPTNLLDIWAGGPELCCAAFFCPYLVMFPDAFTERSLLPGVPTKYHHCISLFCILTGLQYPCSALYLNCFVRMGVMGMSGITDRVNCFLLPCTSCCCLPCAVIQQRILTSRKVSRNQFLHIDIFFNIFILGFWRIS